MLSDNQELWLHAVADITAVREHVLTLELCVVSLAKLDVWGEGHIYEQDKDIDATCSTYKDRASWMVASGRRPKRGRRIKLAVWGEVITVSILKRANQRGLYSGVVYYERFCGFAILLKQINRRLVSSCGVCVCACVRTREIRGESATTCIVALRWCVLCTAGKEIWAISSYCVDKPLTVQSSQVLWLRGRDCQRCGKSIHLFLRWYLCRIYKAKFFFSFLLVSRANKT